MFSLASLLEKVPGDNFEREFEELEVQARELQVRAMKKMSPFRVATAQSNVEKNSYLDIMPYDHNMIELPDKRYINASWVKNWRGENAYIACQGPRFDPRAPKSTAEDFWYMIFHTGASHIVMLCQEQELALVPELGPYWGREDKKVAIGELVLHWIGTEELTKVPGFRRRKITLQDVKTKRIHGVYQYHYSQWMDCNSPSSLTAFCDVLDGIAETYVRHHDHGPLVVHCRAGVGRTGTFIAVHDTVDMVRELLRGGRQPEEIQIDLRSIIARIRADRAFSVQVVAQYRFIYLALHKMLKDILEMHRATLRAGVTSMPSSGSSMSIADANVSPGGGNRTVENSDTEDRTKSSGETSGLSPMQQQQQQ